CKRARVRSGQAYDTNPAASGWCGDRHNGVVQIHRTSLGFLLATCKRARQPHPDQSTTELQIAMQMRAWHLCYHAPHFHTLPMYWNRVFAALLALITAVLAVPANAAQVRNPFAGNAKAAKAGEYEFRINCALCHG